MQQYRIAKNSEEKRIQFTAVDSLEQNSILLAGRSTWKWHSSP